MVRLAPISTAKRYAILRLLYLSSIRDDSIPLWAGWQVARHGAAPGGLDPARGLWHKQP